MDKELEETLSFISNYMFSSVNEARIKDIKYEMARYTEVKFDNEYDKYTIEEFLVVYKIARLEELKIISKKTAAYLKELLDLRLETNKEIGKEALMEMTNPEDNIDGEQIYFSKTLPELIKKREMIDNELRKYSLFIDINEITKLIDYSVKNKLYPPVICEEELKRTIKLLRK